MKVNHYERVTQNPVDMEGAEGCSVRWLVGQEQGAPNFAMRQFEVAVGGHTPKHHHPYEHEVFVLEGSGEVLEGDVPIRCAAATWCSCGRTRCTSSATPAVSRSSSSASYPTRPWANRSP